MNLNENLLRMFAKAVNTTTEKETKMYYGTITDIQETDGVRVPYVHLDGSQPDSKTPLVEGTEVMEGDRVIVTIENHKAVVMSNITSPASARTAKSYMDLFNEGLVIGEIDNDPTDIDFNVLIKPDGVYIRHGVDTDNSEAVVLAKYTGSGIVLGRYNEIVIQASTDQTTVERFSSTDFVLSKTVSSITSIIGETCIDTDTGDTVNDVVLTSEDYTVTGSSVHILSPLASNTSIQPQTVIVTYNFTDNPIGTISIGAKSVMSDQYPLVIGNNNPSKQASNVFSIDWSGRVRAAGGCNAKVIWVDKRVTGLSAPAGVGTNYTTQVTIPAGYTPCGLTAFRVLNHINSDVLNSVDLNIDGSINFCIMNRGSNNWTDEIAYFQVACILTS